MRYNTHIYIYIYLAHLTPNLTVLVTCVGPLTECKTKVFMILHNMWTVIAYA